MSVGSGFFLVLLALAETTSAPELRVREATTDCKSELACKVRVRVTGDWPERRGEPQSIKVLCEAWGPDKRLLGLDGAYAWLKDGRLDEKIAISLRIHDHDVSQVLCTTGLP